MVSKGDQLRKIDALFNENVNSDINNDIKVIETKSTANCNVHNRRRSSGVSSINLNNHNDGVSSSTTVVYRNKKATPPPHKLAGQMELSKRTASIISSFGFDQNLDRRQSYTEGYNQQSLADKTRKRNSWNSNMYNRPLEHPSAFPSLLRSDTAPRKLNTSSVNRSNTHINNSGSANNYDALLYNGGLSSSLSRHASMSAINTNKNSKQKFSTLDNSNKRQSFGSNLYLRTDSSGQTNLVKRDSFGSRSSLPRKGSSVPRDMLFIGSQPNLSHRDLYGSKPNLTRKTSVPRDFNRVASPSLVKAPIITKSLIATKPLPKPIIFEKTSILRKPSIEFYSVDSDKPKLTKENLTRHVRILETDNVQNDNKLRRQSNGSSDDYFKSRRMSIDSLDTRKNSLDSTIDDFSNLSINHLKSISTSRSPSTDAKNENGRPHFVAVTSLEDVQAVRCAEFHPSGRIYAVGSNSKTFRICEYPSLSEVREEHTTYQPTVLFKRTKHHKGSIYCMGWAPDGELVATGSNDKTIKLMRYNEVNKQLEGREIELTMHDGTVRDLCFLEDSTNKASLLISGGAGDCKIYVTDCATATPFQALSGHGGHILSLYNWGGAMFVSGSQDKTIRFWDLRTRGCVNTITPATNPGSRQGSPVAAVCVDPSGRLLVSGHEDSSCVLYDIRGNRPIQCFKPHSADIRSIRFSPSAYYLLTSGYDNKLVLTDLQGDLTLPLPSVVVAHHADKVISGRWHPTDFSFLSTSADKTATLWALPPM